MVDNVTSAQWNAMKETYIQPYFRSLGMPHNWELDHLKCWRTCKGPISDIRLIFQQTDPDRDPGVALEMSYDDNVGIQFCMVNSRLTCFMENFKTEVMKDQNGFLRKAVNISTMFEFFNDLKKR
jgi:hypothetical protein